MVTSTKKRPTPTQVRAARRARQARRRRLIRYGGLSAVSAVAFLFILALILPGLPVPQFGGGGGDNGGDIFETGAADAVEVAAEADAAASLPPVPWGVHADALPAEMYAANIDEGGVVISYNCPDGCDDLVQQLTAVVDEVVDGGSKVILMPNPEIESQLTLAASEVSEPLDAFDEAAIRDFIQANAAANP